MRNSLTLKAVFLIVRCKGYLKNVNKINTAEYLKMGEMMKILVASVGGRDIEQQVLDVARKHAKAFNATLYIASSMERVSEKEQMDLDRIEKHLAHIKETMDAEGIACETHILVRGFTPGEDIVEFAADQKMDEIIIGIEKKSKVGKLLFGSNAQYIIMEASCPVVSVK